MTGPMAAIASNRLGQYASSPLNRAYGHAELAISSLEVAETIASTLPGHGGMAWVALVKYQGGTTTNVTHPSTNQTRNEIRTEVGIPTIVT